MKHLIRWTLAFASSIMLFSCYDVEDPGPLQDTTKEYGIIDFDRLEMGSGFNITVEQGNTFLIRAEGDRRNINDLDVYKSGNTLVIEYDDQEDRKHQTFITIQLPVLRSVVFSGGSVSVISGFESDGELDVHLSGGSLAQLDAGYKDLNIVLSGGSTLKMHGLGDYLHADISGASLLSGFDYPVRDADVNLSGGSNARLTVSDHLKVNASGASSVLYRGNPVVEETLAGEISVHSH